MSNNVEIQRPYIMDYKDAVTRGLIPGAKLFSAYGEKTTTGASEGVVWPNGVFDIPPQPAGLNQMEIYCHNANDTDGGTGIHSLHIHYLDETLTEVDQVETLNGATKTITFPNNCRFIQCSHLDEFGSLRKAAGDIEIRPVGGGQIYSFISGGAERCSSSVRMVPKGKKLLIDTLTSGSISGNQEAGTIVRIAASRIATHSYLNPLVLIPFGANSHQDNSFGAPFPTPVPFVEGDVVGLKYTTDKICIITGMWFGILEDA